eukprot:TRINITY_DN21074_c0_g1_i1.p1 TRINITY_DN21074_c0_g1~~TRINITY_DN21074_c0_g1_i1.p1  ORF type:complete len:145 (+),score=38.01 TRINITY_DN21074_c0_g1_i1:157-591(+)
MPGLNSPSGKEASAAAAAAAAANDRGGDNAEQVMAALLDHHGLVAPQGFDATAAVVAANLPAESSTLSVGAFFSWYAPVVHVQRLEESVLDSDANYTVTFVDEAAAKRVVDMNIQHFVDGGEATRPIRVRHLPHEEASSSSWWS